MKQQYPDNQIPQRRMLQSRRASRKRFVLIGSALVAVALIIFAGRITLTFERISKGQSAVLENGEDAGFAPYKNSDRINVLLMGLRGVEDPEGGQVTFRVEGINYGTSAEQRYVDFTVITGFDAYCNYNGNIQEQKVRNTDGSWASCQNNYECESNFCSGGQCVEINQLIGQASAFKGFFVRTLCRLSNLFDDDGYNACIGQYLG